MAKKSADKVIASTAFSLIRDKREEFFLKSFLRQKVFLQHFSEG